MTHESKGIAATEPIVFDDETRKAFLERIADDPAVGHVAAMRELGVVGTRGQIRAAIEEQLADAIADERGDVVRNEIMRRAVEGVDEAVYYKGEVVGYNRVLSDRALELAARCYVPESREHVEVTGTLAGTLEIEGRVQLGFEELFRRRAELGLGDSGGLGPAGDRRALPAASDVLPDPAAD